MTAQKISAQLQTLLAILSDGQPHASADLRARLDYMNSQTFARRLEDLRRLGHDVRKVTDRLDPHRKARVVEYQLF